MSPYMSDLKTTICFLKLTVQTFKVISSTILLHLKSREAGGDPENTQISPIRYFTAQTTVTVKDGQSSTTAEESSPGDSRWLQGFLKRKLE